MQSQHFYIPLAGKTAVVTGASRGISAGIALELATQGANVLVTYAAPSNTDQVASLIEKVKDLENGSHTIGVRANLLHPTSVDLIFGKSTTFSRPKLDNGKPKIDILVNNAGVELVKRLGSITPEDFESVYNLNEELSASPLSAPDAASLGCPYIARVKLLLKDLLAAGPLSLRKNGTTVNCVNPGPVKTKLVENIPKDIVEQQKTNTPIEKRLGTVDDVAKVVSWLAGEDSRWITGQIISASGGWAMY